MPSLGEVQADPRARKEALVAARQLNPAHLAEVAKAQKDESEKATSTLRRNWQRWWDLWSSEVTFRDKEEWQSQVWVPKPFVAVEQASALIKRSLLDSPDFWGIDGTDEDDKLKAAHVWKPLLKLLLNQARFIPKYAAACKVGFIMGVAGYLKFRWQISQTPQLAGASVDPDTGVIVPEFQDKTRSMLAIDYVLPWHIRRDPDTVPLENFSGTYLWHSEFKDRAVVSAMARFWDKDAITRLLASPRTGKASNASDLQESEQRDAERKQYGYERSKFRTAYLIDEGHLDIIDQNGDVVLPNGLMIHSHGEMLLMPQDAPLWATDLSTGRRKWPFAATPTIEHPSRFEGRGILEQDEDLSLMYSNTLNLFADAMNWKVNKGSEVYQPGLVDWDDTSDYPGKLWIKNVKERVLLAAERGEVNVSEVMAFLNFIDQQRQNANFVTDFVQGAPGYRSDITLGETKIKTAQSMGVFEGMARNLELGGKVAVELAYDLAAQFLGGNDYTDPSVVSILGPEVAMLLAQMPLAERIAHLQGNFDYTFTGVSTALQKADFITKVMQFGTLAGTPAYIGHTKPGQFLKVIGEALGITDKIDIIETLPPAAPPMPGPAGPPAAGGAPGAPIQNGPEMMRAIGAGAGGAG